MVPIMTTLKYLLTVHCPLYGTLCTVLINLNPVRSKYSIYPGECCGQIHETTSLWSLVRGANGDRPKNFFRCPFYNSITVYLWSSYCYSFHTHQDKYLQSIGMYLQYPNWKYKRLRLSLTPFPNSDEISIIHRAKLS